MGAAGRVALGSAATSERHEPCPRQSQPYHYAVIGRAIDHIVARAPEQASLDEIAASVGLSPAHFQRVFSQWVGVSPKRYQQYLALDHAKRLLAERHTVARRRARHRPLRVGPAARPVPALGGDEPGEYARAGEGLEIAWGWFDTPFGPALAMGTDRGLCGLAFAAETGREAAMADMRARWPRARLRRGAGAPRALGRRRPSPGGGETRLHLIGAPFQIKVWEALLQVPSGHVTTYSDIADRHRPPDGGRAPSAPPSGATRSAGSSPATARSARPAASAATTGGSTSSGRCSPGKPPASTAPPRTPWTKPCFRCITVM